MIKTCYYSLILFSLSFAQLHDLTFLITVPDSTDQVYLLGSHRKLGNWDHGKAVRFEKANDTLFMANVPLPTNQTIEFKFTRGSWEKEALDENLSVPQNYSIEVGEQDTVHYTIHSWKDWISFPMDQITGKLIVHENVYSLQLDNYRTVLVWLPPSYETYINKRYPVLYLHDGQNVFTSGLSLSGQEWSLDETVTELIDQQKIEEIIMVAVYHGENRTEEYSPKHKGKQYSEFLIKTIKPWIDEEYRTKPGRDHTAVLGSSMGGIISFHLGWEYSYIFSMAGCLSPAFLVDDNEIVKRVKNSQNKPVVKFTIQNGTKELEARLQPAVQKMIHFLKKKGYTQDTDYFYRIYNGASHTEEEWAKQVKDTLLYFFSV